jgi:hypothetical protein
MANHTFTKHDPDNYRPGELFHVDKRVNGLTVNLHNSYVREVTDEPGQWEQVAEQGAAQFLGNVPNVGLPASAALIRSALRPASQGGGRGRWR